MLTPRYYTCMDANPETPLTYWQKEKADFAAFMKANPGASYVDWQPTKWQSLSVLRQRVQRFCQSAGAPISSAIELGCGSSTLLLQLALDGVSVTGIDRDRDALDLAEAAHASLNAKRPSEVALRCDDFERLSHPLTPADLLLSVGVIEHFDLAGQRRVFQEHARLSKRWVLIAIPNIASPLFKSFLKARKAEGRLYEDEHLPIDVPSLAREHGASVSIDDGCHLFLSKGDDTQFACHEYSAFNFLLRERLLRLDPSRYQAFPRIDLFASDIPALIEVESTMPAVTRRRFGFLRWYLIDLQTRATPSA